MYLRKKYGWGGIIATWVVGILEAKSHRCGELMQVEELLMWINSIGGENIEVEESNMWNNYGGREIVEVDLIINVEEL